ncbi:plasmid pRiA4b ORF-3 family protein [Actinospica robiniae]|uniref:plasmid pRiA4b ORF-3 family protein n=1 Tax=Actinospica robiniae TaxID=304901 RepID=UPI0004271C98|nr:plasmid pRiA4b ORF-3 family protein [Actinospica robiniae]
MSTDHHLGETEPLGGGEPSGRSEEPADPAPLPPARRSRRKPDRDAAPTPARAGGLDAAAFAAALLTDLARVAEREDPFAFELTVSGFAAILEGALPADAVADLVGRLEARADPLALAVLATLALITDGPAGAVAGRGAARLWRAGILPPFWFEELDRDVVAEECLSVRRPLGERILLCSFRRAGRRHAFAITLEDGQCPAFKRIAPLTAVEVPARLADLVAQLVPPGEIEEAETEPLSPAEARSQLESALRLRASHDAGLDLEARLEQWTEADDDPLAPPVPTMIPVLRHRVEHLPASAAGAGGPAGAELEFGAGLDLAFPDFPGAAGIELFIGAQPGPGATHSGFTAGRPAAYRSGKSPAASDAAASRIYRLRIDLKGAKPPIWRRVEVPGDLTLAGLHEVIQTVFEWEGSHLHVFETPLGEFGDGDVALGHRHDGEVTVDQILQGNAKIGYVYDYGDYWEHVIRVESVKEPEPGTVYPRCIGGRRAAPPEDCGGMARYQDSLRRHGDAGADVFDLAELDRRLHDGWHHPS